MLTQAPLQSQRSPKKKRSLKRAASPRRPADPSRVLPVSIDQNELTGIMERIATGQEKDPNVAFSRIYTLALDSIADAIKGALLNLVQNLQKIPDSELPPFISGLIPDRDPETLKRVSQSLTQKIDLSREKIQIALTRQSKAPACQNYESFAKQMRSKGVQSTFQNALNNASRALMPSHVTADRLREICEDVKHYKPEKSTHDTFKIDLSRIPGRGKFHFSTGTPKPAAKTDKSSQTIDAPVAQQPEIPASDVAQTDAAQTDAACDEITPLACDETSQTQPVCPECVSTPQPVSDAPAAQLDTNTQNVLPDTDTVDVIQPVEPESATDAHVEPAPLAKTPAPSDSISSQIQGLVEQIPAGLEQAFLSAALANQADTAIPDKLSTIESQATDTLKTFGVELVQTFDGLTNMMSEFANQLTAAIIEDQAHRLPTLSEALKNDPRLQNDQELKDFVSFLDDEKTLPDDNVSIDNDELAAAFGSLLDMLDD